MIENGSELKIYYNDHYEDYSEICYLIYCNGGGVYLSTPDESVRIVQKNYPASINLENIDQYAFSRDFKRVLDVKHLTYDDRKDIVWYRNTIPDFKERMQKTLNELLRLTRYSATTDPYIVHLYCIMNNLLQVI